MKYQTQEDALARMELETRRAMRRFEDLRVATLAGLWTATKRLLKSEIALEYAAAFPGGKWNLSDAKRLGVLLRISRALHTILEGFKMTARDEMRGGIEKNHHLETLRAAWMLDQATPPNTQIRLPGPVIREADVPTDPDWMDYLDAWVDAYEQTLGANLFLGALNGGSQADAMREVDASKIKTPGGMWDIGNLMEGLYTNALLRQQSEARDGVARANEEAMMVEIWQTLEDARVCPECDDYDGEPRDSISEDIPAHYNCRCFYRLVPKPWAELLASGGEAEKALAISLDELGLVPSSMVIRGDDGNPMGAVQVNFETWAGKMAGISGGVQ